MRHSVRRLFPYLRRYRRSLGLGMGALVVKDLAHVAQPFLIGYGVDTLLAGFSLQKVFLLAGALVCTSLVKGFFQYWMRVILIGMSRDVEYDLRNDLFRHLTRLSGDFYGRYRTGDIMARATNDLNAVRMMLGPGLMYWFETSLTLIFAVVVMALMDWKLTLIALSPTPVVSAVVFWFGSRIHSRFESIQKLFSDISSRVQEDLSGVRVIRAYVQEAARLRQFEILNRGFIKENLRLAWLSGLFMPMLQALIGGAFLLILWAGGSRVLAGHISVGQFVMFNTYMGLLIWPMIAVGWVVNLTQRGTASLNRIWELLEEQPGIAAPASGGRTLADEPRGEIAFENVTLRYGLDGRTALDRVSLTIPAGATIAIVGHTGSGKTSLVNLIPRMLDPTEGTVRLDGIDLRELDPAALRRHIGFVPQETFLFSSTLAENIAFGVPDASRSEIEKAAERAGLAPDLGGFPNGLDTVIGERGLTLSGGQKQRTAIARALLRNPRILILDDALSAVDTITEERILQSLEQLLQDRTTILISHRVSTVRDADTIYVIENGRVAEQGSHEELVALGGYYADLYQKQLLEDELAVS